MKLEGSPRLVGDSQHTAGTVAPAYPARHPSSNASSPVKEKDQVRFGHASDHPARPSSE